MTDAADSWDAMATGVTGEVVSWDMVAIEATGTVVSWGTVVIGEASVIGAVLAAIEAASAAATIIGALVVLTADKLDMASAIL